jgi:hypothetical protein
MLIRAYYSKPSIFNSTLLNEVEMNRQFIHTELISLNIKVSLNYITKQKSIPFIQNSVPQVDLTLEMLNRVLLKYPDFNVDLFLMR